MWREEASDHDSETDSETDLARLSQMRDSRTGGLVIDWMLRERREGRRDAGCWMLGVSSIQVESHPETRPRYSEDYQVTRPRG